MLPSKLDQKRISLTPATPEAEDAWEQMEIRHTSFLLRNILVLQSTLTCGNSVEHWEHIFLTRNFDIGLAYAQFTSNIQVIYHHVDHQADHQHILTQLAASAGGKFEQDLLFLFLRMGRFRGNTVDRSPHEL